jgi:hypothetical protein
MFLKDRSEDIQSKGSVRVGHTEDVIGQEMSRQGFSDISLVQVFLSCSRSKSCTGGMRAREALAAVLAFVFDLVTWGQFVSCWGWT